MELTFFEGQTHLTTGTNFAVDVIETPQGILSQFCLATFPFWSCSLELWLLVPWLLYGDGERGAVYRSR